MGGKAGEADEETQDDGRALRQPLQSGPKENMKSYLYLLRKDFDEIISSSRTYVGSAMSV